MHNFSNRRENVIQSKQIWNMMPKLCCCKRHLNRAVFKIDSSLLFSGEHGLQIFPRPDHRPQVNFARRDCQESKCPQRNG